MNLTKSHYIKEGFKSVGNIFRDSKIDVKKYHTHVTWNYGFDPKNKIGVYIIYDGDSIRKIGQSKDLKYRFQCYVSHIGPTNVKVRKELKENVIYDILFIECIVENEVFFGGVKVPSGVYYQILEKNLLIQFKENNLDLFNKLWNEGLS